MSQSGLKTEFEFSGYGKNFVKVLQLRREGKIHYVKEIEVSTQLTLNNTKDYIHGDNSDIIATDSQKNTVYVLARQHGIETIEKFALTISDHFLRKYSHVTNTQIYIEEAPWKRISVDGQEHVHAFFFSKEAIRRCEVTQERGGKPLLRSGLKEMRIMKTTQSAFRKFVDDEFRTLPDADDRLFCTVVDSWWWYNSVNSVDFTKVWEGIKGIVLDTFAGPATTGVFSPSVQNTLHLTVRNVLSKIPQVEKMEITLPNVHYFGMDYNKFTKINLKDYKNEVYMPTDKPSGNISARIQRSRLSKL
ncbi:uricase-like [Mytilus galloprovincialis]|uniref:uricase-like n=1 Tax=Mytilus galloprovincialis TaxID=29158 RepID=UPI003F7CA635